MDYIRANPDAPFEERDQISGCRVFDGEDQGIQTIFNTKLNLN